jgi:Ca2+-transporting ATPase
MQATLTLGPLTLPCYLRQIRAASDDDVFKLNGFTSARKMSSVLIKKAGGGYRLYNKGAAEWVVKRCTSIMQQDG